MGGDPAGPLQGMRVLDLSQQLPGPYCTLLLASLGATVTKVEPEYGDAARHLDPEMFQRVNKGKVSLRLDLKTVAGQQRLQELAQVSDVFVEGFRPGVTARLGCDFARLSELNPALVYCSISGFGQSGPLASQPTHDLSLQAVAGALGLSENIESVGVPWVDLGTATVAAFLIAAHWRTGRAVHLDLAMLDVASGWAATKPTAVARREPTYGTFTSADGAQVVLALLEDDMWERLCRALSLESWSVENGFEQYPARVENATTIRERIATELSRRSSSDLVELASMWDLPLDRVLTLAESADNEQVVWRRRGRAADDIAPVAGTSVTLSPLVEG